MSTEGQLVTEQPKTSIVEYTETETALAALRQQYKGVIFGVTTTAGDKAARAARKQLVTLRTSLEKMRLRLNSDDRERIENRNMEAQRITTQIEALETPIDEQITAEENRKETERQAKVDAEIKRAADLQERVSELRGLQTLSPTDGSVLIAQHIEDLDKIPADESFQEFQQQATDAKAAGLARLQAVHAAAIAHEAEQARITAEREELAGLRAAAAIQAVKDKARRDEEERVAKVARDAETARHNEQLRLQREEQETASRAERKRIADEDARLAADRAELARQQEELRKSQEPPKLAVTRRGVAVKAPSAADIVDVLAKHYKAHPDTIVDWLRQIDFAQVQAA